MTKEINLFHFSEAKQEPESSSSAPKPLDKENRQLIKRVIEALLFATNEPLAFDKLREIIETKFPLQPRTLHAILDDLESEYIHQQRSFRLEQTSQGILLKTCEEYAPFIEQLFRNKRGEKLSQAASEVLAIVAYKQPITKPQIDAIRGVDCSGIIQNLLERELIQPAGKLEAPGRPTLYNVTAHFLLHFGLRDLSELPGMQSKHPT